MSSLLILARLLLSAVFISGGYHAYNKPGGRVAKAAALGVPHPELATKANGVVMVLAGATMAIGLRPRESAAVLILSMIPTTLAGHPFWKEETPEGRSAQQTQFMKNLGLIGGLLAVIVAEGYS